MKLRIKPIATTSDYHTCIIANKARRIYLGSMTPYEFSTLSENEQADVTWQGKFFLSRDDRDHTVLLYKVHDFYVEAYYNNRSNEFVRFNPVHSKKKFNLSFGVQLN